MKQENIDFVVSGLIIQNNSVLMLWHKKLNAWLFPGGHIEKNETLEEALIRECKEEVNLDIEFIENKVNDLSTSDVREENLPFCILKEPIDEPNNFHYHIDFIFKIKPINSMPASIAKDTKWINKNDILEIQTFKNVKKLLNKILD